MLEGDAVKKIYKQLGKAKIIDEINRKIKPKKIYINQKRDEFTDKEDFEIHPSDPIPPRLYGTVKTHKPENTYLMHIFVLTIDTPPYGISKCLIKMIRPALNNSQHKIKNSVQFVNEVKPKHAILIGENETVTSSQ